MSDFSAEKVKAIIADRLQVDLDRVVPEAAFIADLGADSLDLVELIMGFEEDFDIVIPDSDSEGIKTVADALAYLEKATIPK